jgi:predicted 2-oxoglutarate/Fe(II)-dependent dioxygenase YbiX
MKEYILEVKKIIPQTFCKKIISYFDNNYQDAGTVGDGVNRSIINKNVRNCLTRSILDTKTFGEVLYSNAIKEKIFDCVSYYQKKFNHVHITKISQLDILRYDFNEHKAGYKFHEDFGLTTSERHLSISICLNNEYTGGEFVFKLDNGSELTIPQNVGDAVIFPSNFMFPHQVNKVTEGTRYALIGWVI